MTVIFQGDDFRIVEERRKWHVEARYNGEWVPTGFNEYIARYQEVLADVRDIALQLNKAGPQYDLPPMIQNLIKRLGEVCGK